MAKSKKTSASKARTSRKTKKPMTKKPMTKKPVKKKAPSTKRKASSTKVKKSTRAKKASAKKTEDEISEEITEETATIDRRKSDRRGVSALPTAGKGHGEKIERREKVNRRRQIDPTTCERDYSEEEIEFMNAMELYKRKSGRMFPTCSEVLEVLRKMGYVRRGELAEPAVSSNVAQVETENTETENTEAGETPVVPVTTTGIGFDQSTPTGY